MDENTYEIGLVGAGAISAGAYTAGVIDFLVYALDEWYKAKETTENVPDHDVKISVFSGASAGAMTAAMATGFLCSDQPPIATPEEGLKVNGKNKLFDSWVNRIDISYLLESRDLEDKVTPVPSLLDSTVLTEIADDALNITPRDIIRPYLSDNFELMLTVTNLRGVPYSFALQSGRKEYYDMSLHADYIHVRINESGTTDLVDRYCMSWQDFDSSSPVKELIKQSAVASGAFPIGLAPRDLSHIIPGLGQPDYYSSRKWPIPNDNNTDQCISRHPVPAKWELIGRDYTYNFRCVDGGVMNNEPLEMARKILAANMERIDRDTTNNKKAILMIDPFPNETTFDADKKYKKPDLVSTALELFTALKNQARFKPDELLLAAQKDVASRYMIAPKRKKEKYPIACGSLGGFGGFLKRNFREHDFFLGRRNAQIFLKNHFVLPENNPLFNKWANDEETVSTYCVKERANNTPVTNDGKKLLPIIPLVGGATSECISVPWPEYSEKDKKLLLQQIKKRLKIIVERLVDQYFKENYSLTRFIAKMVLKRKEKDVVKWVDKSITKPLRDMHLFK